MPTVSIAVPEWLSARRRGKQSVDCVEFSLMVTREQPAAASHQFVFQLQWAVMFEFQSKQVNLEDLGCQSGPTAARLEQQLEEMSATDYDRFLVEVNQKVLFPFSNIGPYSGTSNDRPGFGTTL